MADPNAKESKTKTKAGRDSRRLQTRESRLQNTYHRGVSVLCSGNSPTEGVRERMWLLRILTCFARVLRPGGTSWPTAADELNIACRKSFRSGRARSEDA